MNLRVFFSFETVTILIGFAAVAGFSAWIMAYVDADNIMTLALLFFAGLVIIAAGLSIVFYRINYPRRASL